MCIIKIIIEFFITVSYAGISQQHLLNRRIIIKYIIEQQTIFTSPVFSCKCPSNISAKNTVNNTRYGIKGIVSAETTMHAFCSARNIPNKCSLVQHTDYGGGPYQTG